MDAYVFQAALLCEACAKETRESLKDHPPADDSGDYPQGPYSEGGGEADCPQHCDNCGVFLENPLTSDGYAYVREALAEESGAADVLATWREFYGNDLTGGAE